MSAGPVIVVHVEGEPDAPWIEALSASCPGWRVLSGEHVPPALRDEVRLAVVWDPPPGFLGAFPALERIVSVGSGLDHLRRDYSRAPHVPILPRRDPAGIRSMAEFVLMQVLLHHRGLGPALFADRIERRWAPLTRGPLSSARVAILGFGPMAQASADLLAGFCRVTAWSRSPRTHPLVPVQSGWERLDGVFADADILVNLLPSTDETRGLIDARRLGLLPRGAGLINVGRGDAVDHAALLHLLDSGHLALASLDVQPVEPPPADDRVWTHPRVILTPHIASVADPVAFARWMAAAVLADGDLVGTGSAR